jgi:hypothetical protein
MYGINERNKIMINNIDVKDENNNEKLYKSYNGPKNSYQKN